MFRLPASNHVTTPRDSRRPLLGVFLTACLLAAPGLSQTAPTHEPPKAAEDLLTGRRFLTFNTVVRVNQIEVTRDQSKGEDESIVHTPAEARLFRETIEEAWPGDVIGLVNAGDVRAGDTLYLDEPVTFPEIPSFPPEHFRQASAYDPSKHKQFQRGIQQLDQEGVIQVLLSENRPSQMPVLAAVGPMQFEVVAHRMEHEFNAPLRLDPLPLGIAFGISAADAHAVDAYRGAEAAQRSDGTWLALFADAWQARWFSQRNPDVALESITPDPAGPASA